MFWKYTILTAMSLVGVWLLFFFEDSHPNAISGLEMWLTLIGFVMSLGGVFGIIALLGREMQKQEVTTEERVWWELTRTEGRSGFIRNVVLTATMIGGTFISLIILQNSNPAGSYLWPIISCLVIFVAVGFASYAVADHLWKVSGTRMKLKSDHDKEPRLIENEAFKDFELPTAREQTGQREVDRMNRD